jgi:hypothetical protein
LGGVSSSPESTSGGGMLTTELFWSIISLDRRLAAGFRRATFFFAGAAFFRAEIFLAGALFFAAPRFAAPLFGAAFLFIATFLFAAAFVLRLGAALRPALRFFAFAIVFSVEVEISLADKQMRIRDLC